MKIAMVFQRVPPHRHSGAKLIPGLHSKGHALDPGSAPSGMAGLRSGLRDGKERRRGCSPDPESAFREGNSGRPFWTRNVRDAGVWNAALGSARSHPGNTQGGVFPHPDSKRSVCAPVLLRFPHQNRTLLPQNRHFAAGTRSSTSE